jgi:hypothetical protein
MFRGGNEPVVVGAQRNDDRKVSVIEILLYGCMNKE